MKLLILLVCSSFLLHTSGFAFRHISNFDSAVARVQTYRNNRAAAFSKDVQLTIRFYGSSNEKDEIDETTEKYGLEAGLLKAMQSEDEEKKKVKPKELLAKYGVAYLATSITLAIISYTICYILISNGVDVAALLEKVGIQSTTATANAGTAALAYAVHKAASPIRFPPTVALTPVVAKWIGKGKQQSGESDD